MVEFCYPASLTDGVVRLRPWRDGDVSCVEQAAQDPRIPAGTSVPARYTPEEGRAFIHRQHSRLTTGRGISFAVARHATDDAVGLVFLGNRPEEGVASIGYWIVPAARGHGLATRAVRLASDWALHAVRLARVEAWVEPHNHASQRVLEANGFLRQGLLRNALPIKERRADVFVYSRIQPPHPRRMKSTA